jgi:hypothetical protein
VWVLLHLLQQVQKAQQQRLPLQLRRQLQLLRSIKAKKPVPNKSNLILHSLRLVLLLVHRVQ